jgi:hypothetical protein
MVRVAIGAGPGDPWMGVPRIGPGATRAFLYPPIPPRPTTTSKPVQANEKLCITLKHHKQFGKRTGYHAR